MGEVQGYLLVADRKNLKVINKDQQEQVILDFVKEYNHFIGEVEGGYMEEINSLLQLIVYYL